MEKTDKHMSSMCQGVWEGGDLCYREQIASDVLDLFS
jgi:hypothetical protein